MAPAAKRIAELEAENKRLRGLAKTAMGPREGVGSPSSAGHGASIQQLQELLEVCVRVQPNAEHTADIRRQLEAAKQAKADARPMAAQLLAAERKVNKRKAAAENAAKRVADLEVQLGQARVDEADRRREFADAQTELAAVHRKALEAGPGLGAGERVDVRQLLP